jgi:hypothetical protein
MATADDHDDFWSPTYRPYGATNTHPNVSNTTVGTHDSHRTQRSRHAHFVTPDPTSPHLTRKNPPTQSAKPLFPLKITNASNLLSRILQVKPAKRILPLLIPRDRALGEIRSIWRDWQRYGMCEVQIDRVKGTVRASVKSENTLGIKPVTILAEVYPVAMTGKASGLSIVRLRQERGAKSSFEEAYRALRGVLRGRAVLVLDEKWKKDMRNALLEWEKIRGL